MAPHWSDQEPDGGTKSAQHRSRKGFLETGENARDSRKQQGGARPVLQDVVSLNLITDVLIELSSAEGRQPESKIPGGGHTGQATISCQMWHSKNQTSVNALRVKIYLDSIDSSSTISLKNGQEKVSPSKFFSTSYASELQALVRALVLRNWEKLSAISEMSRT